MVCKIQQQKQCRAVIMLYVHSLYVRAETALVTFTWYHALFICATFKEPIYCGMRELRILAIAWLCIETKCYWFESNCTSMRMCECMNWDCHQASDFFYLWSIIITTCNFPLKLALPYQNRLHFILRSAKFHVVLCSGERLFYSQRIKCLCTFQLALRHLRAF